MSIKELILRLLYRGRHVDYARKLGVTIGENCRIISTPMWGSEPYLISIGNHVELSSGVSFITHDGATWVFRNDERYKDVIRYGKIIIHDNCFIGMHSTILPGVSIGPNSIVGAGSLVRKNVEPNSVYAGVPAKRICSINEYAEKCLRETPDYDKRAYSQNKQAEVLRVLSKTSK